MSAVARRQPGITRDPSKLEMQAAKVLEPEALGYILAGAGDGATARANSRAFRRWRMVPRKASGAARRLERASRTG